MNIRRELVKYLKDVLRGARLGVLIDLSAMITTSYPTRLKYGESDLSPMALLGQLSLDTVNNIIQNDTLLWISLGVILTSAQASALGSKVPNIESFYEGLLPNNRDRRGPVRALRALSLGLVLTSASLLIRYTAEKI